MERGYYVSLWSGNLKKEIKIHTHTLKRDIGYTQSIQKTDLHAKFDGFIRHLFPARKLNHGESGYNINLAIVEMYNFLTSAINDQIFKDYIQTFFESEQWIVGVSIELNGTSYTLPGPNRHHHALALLADSYNPEVEGIPKEGFLVFKSGELSTIGRKEALVIVTKNGQLRRLLGDNYYQGDKLFSEDLW